MNVTYLKEAAFCLWEASSCVTTENTSCITETTSCFPPGKDLDKLILLVLGVSYAILFSIPRTRRFMIEAFMEPFRRLERVIETEALETRLSKIDYEIVKKSFFGREKELSDIANESLRNNESPLVTSLVGPAGVGKTQLALEVATRLQSTSTFISSINAKDESSLISSYACLAQKLGIPFVEGEKMSLVEKVNHHLERNPGWLLIFDDAEKAEAIQEFFPQRGGRILITSRTSDWSSLAKTFEIKPFSLEESMALFSAIIDLLNPKETPKSYRIASGLFRANQLAGARLCQLLGNNPLAITQAAHYIQATNIPIANFFAKIAKSHEMKSEESVGDHIQSTINLTLERILEEETPTSIIFPLLQACSLLGSKKIPRQLLLENWIQFTCDEKISASEVYKALDRLQQYSIIHLSEEYVEMHELVQKAIRDRLSPEELRNLIEKMAAFFIDYIPPGQNSPLIRYWEQTPPTINRLYSLLPHALSLATHAQNAGLKDEAVGLLVNIGSFLYDQGNLRLAETTLRRAQAIEERDEICKKLGHACIALGKLTEARGYFEKCQDDDGLIRLLIKEKNFKEAKEKLEEELNKLHAAPQVVGTTDKRYSIACNLKYLGYIHLKEKNFQEALSYFQQSKEYFLQVYRDPNTYTAEADYYMARAYKAEGRTEKQIEHLLGYARVYKSIAEKDPKRILNARFIKCIKLLDKFAKEEIPTTGKGQRRAANFLKTLPNSIRSNLDQDF